MTTLRQALDTSVETDPVVDLDHVDLQRRGATQRWLLRFGTVGAGVATLAVGAAIVIGVNGLQPASVDVASGPSTGPSADSATVERGPSGETYQQWHARKLQYIEDAITEASTTEQADALADGHVTEQEFTASAQAWVECIRDAGYDVTLSRQGPPKGAVGSSLNIAGPTDAEFEAVDAGCNDAYHGTIDAVWQHQHTDYRQQWDEWLELAENRPPATGPVEEMSTLVPIDPDTSQG